MHGDSFQRKLAIVKNGVTPTSDKPKRSTPASYAGRSSVPNKSQRSRSMSVSPERVRVRGRSPAFNALATTLKALLLLLYHMTSSSKIEYVTKSAKHENAKDFGDSERCAFTPMDVSVEVGNRHQGLKCFEPSTTMAGSSGLKNNVTEVIVIVPFCHFD
ncbi:villin-3-like isoform X2 [Canna indica]|uniref:Villin-3-like isoform X2 n=1 Tax=Canna indica TaxID=4628 RepID=A0AAQ3KUC7_9LILI|nr:villin-3-like isoform X2 [Canna indica]